MRAWLRSEQIVQRDGSVLSWANPAHPGFAYPEAAGLMLSHLSLEAPGWDPLRERIIARLCRDVLPDGGVGRGATPYAFDSAIVLAGLMAHARASQREGDEALNLAQKVADFLLLLLRARRAIGGPSGVDGDHRWSRSYGAHLLKCVIALRSWFESSGDLRCIEVCEQLEGDLLESGASGRFPTRAGARETYLHAYCYAVEGLLALQQLGGDRYAPRLACCASWLASVQRDDGALPSWHDGERSWGAAHADVAAQAVRIWCRVNPVTFRPQIDRALRFLAALQAPCGGIRYAPASDDINVWATIFAVQAADWASQGVDRQWTI